MNSMEFVPPKLSIYLCHCNIKANPNNKPHSQATSYQMDFLTFKVASIFHLICLKKFYCKVPETIYNSLIMSFQRTELGMIFMAIDNIYEKCRKAGLTREDEHVFWVQKLYTIRVSCLFVDV